MRTRNIEKHFFFDKSEAQDLARKARKAGLSESALVRHLVCGYAPREKPDDRFFEVMRQLAALGNVSCIPTKQSSDRSCFCTTSPTVWALLRSLIV